MIVAVIIGGIVMLFGGLGWAACRMAAIADQRGAQ